MTKQEHEESAAVSGLAEWLYEVGFPPERAQRIAEWIASFGEPDTEVP